MKEKQILLLNNDRVDILMKTTTGYEVCKVDELNINWSASITSKHIKAIK